MITLDRQRRCRDTRRGRRRPRSPPRQRGAAADP